MLALFLKELLFYLLGSNNMVHTLMLLLIPNHHLL